MHPDRHQLRQARRALDLTLAEVAEAVGVGRSSISLVESGANSEPNPDMLAKLVSFYEARGVGFGSEGQVRLRPDQVRVAGHKVN